MIKKTSNLVTDNLPPWLEEYPGAEGTGWYLAAKFGDIYAPHPTQEGMLLKLPYSPRDKYLTTEAGDQDWSETITYNAVEAAIDIGLLDIGLDSELARLLAEDTEFTTEH